MSLVNDPATPTAERCVTSYPARRAYRPGVIYPPQVPGVADAIDIHVHAHEGQNDPLALAKLASESGMGGLLYKTFGPISGGEYRPGVIIKKLREDLQKWSDETGVKPVKCWAGAGITMDNKPWSVAKVRQHLADGVVGIWMPVFNHANTLSKVGGKPIWWDKNADPAAHTPPLSWEESLKHGHYLLGDNGKLKPEIEEIIRVVADAGSPLFFAHATHPELFAMIEFMDKINFRQGVVDHPFSPFVDLDIPQMKQVAAAGMFLNFTFDELSPLLGVDPQRMYEAIRAVGVEQVTLSSDGGEPLFPHCVECLRLVRAYMAAFGLNDDELRTVCVTNPARAVGAAMN
jgi:hypothetical protein